MRKRFEQQLSLGVIAISEVAFKGRVLKSRDELPPVLLSLQQLFLNKALNEQVFAILEQQIQKKKIGRRGMDLWQVLVLATVRHTLDTNWDRLEDLANHHGLLRQLLGVGTQGDVFGEQSPQFCYQTIVDNVSLLDATVLAKINEVVVSYGHQLLCPKIATEGMALKTDSYVLETNIHFPTDLNLLWDSLRKALDTVKQLKTISTIKGWRKLSSIRSTTKSLFRNASRQVFSNNGKNETQKIKSVTDYLTQASWLQQRFEQLQQASLESQQPLLCVALTEALRGYVDYIIKFSDQIERRLLKGETIAASEKIYSIFEPHTEWISKGKQHKRVELGHNILLTTDQHQFIVDYRVMEKQCDVQQIQQLYQRLEQKYPGQRITSHSFDKGFYSKDNQAALEQLPVEQPILPKKGKLSKADKQREHTSSFIALRHQHSAVESNINMLEHHGLNRCMDKGLHHYKRTVGLSVLAYNLHIIGNHLLLQKQKDEARQKIGKRVDPAWSTAA